MPEGINPDRWVGMLRWLTTRLNKNEAIIPDVLLADEAHRVFREKLKL
jgi:hypothetical protein